MGDGPRSYDAILDEDLVCLATLAHQDRKGFMQRNPHHGGLNDRIVLVALCQGAALHYLNGTNGVQDFDVWTFYDGSGTAPAYPPRRRGRALFESVRFADCDKRVDLLGRSLPPSLEKDPLIRVRDYLNKRPTRSAYELSCKAVVVLEPANHRGQIIWPLPADQDGYPT
jgi:hypothetical protein